MSEMLEKLREATTDDACRRNPCEQLRSVANAAISAWEADRKLLAQYEAGASRLQDYIEVLEKDKARMDYLEGEELSRSDTLFRRNCPITRAAVDAALAAEEKKP